MRKTENDKAIDRIQEKLLAIGFPPWRLNPEGWFGAIREELEKAEERGRKSRE